MKRDGWVTVGWFMAALVTVLAAAGFVGLLVTAPVAAGWLGSLATIGAVCWLVPNRALRAELEGARYRLSTYNGSETHEALAEVGPVTGPTKTVELFDGAQLAEWREQAERPRDIYSPDSVAHLGQACGWSDDGTTLCGEPAEGWARWPDDEPVWLCGVHGEWMRERPSTDGRRVD